MAGLLNNLYPPIIASYMPAFVLNKSNSSCRIYFSISDYNSIEEVRAKPQVLIKYQSSNLSAFNNVLYPNGIKVLDEIKIDNERANRADKYYVEIFSSDMDGGTFQINQYYKVQIRFTSFLVANSYDSNTSSPSAKWLAENATSFSEWSTVCLIRGISPVILDLHGFESNQVATFSTSFVNILGKISFADIKETETLKSYRIVIKENNNVIEDSGDILSNIYNNINNIDYICKTAINEGNVYQLSITIVTRNLYEETYNYNFRILPFSTGSALPFEIKAEPNEELGCAEIRFDLARDNDIIVDQYMTNIIIRRTSSRSDFLIWEDVCQATLIGTEYQNFVWKDKTVESGIWYYYAAQEIDNNKNRGIVIKTAQPFRVDFEDMFLMADNKQIRIRYNQDISSFRRNVMESKIDTIGSKFAYIKRNADISYYSFPIAGTITFLNDHENDFLTLEEAYGQNSVDFYEQFNTENQIGDYNNYVFEREFRNKLVDFLYADNVKLIRTPTEGNYIIKIMDLNFNAETALGRYIYSFSATAYEVDYYNMYNIDRYNIQSIVQPDYLEILRIAKQKYSQLSEAFPANKNVCLSIIDKCNQEAGSGNKATFKNLSFVHFEFQSDPYLIYCGSHGEIRPVEIGEEVLDNTVYGYIMYINGVPILVSPEGYYELAGDNTNIESITFPVKTYVNIDYIVEFFVEKDYGRVPVSVFVDKKVGQMWGTFYPEESVFKKIWKKYLINFTNYYEKLISISRITIEAEPSTVVWVKENLDRGFNRHKISELGNLQIWDEFTIIEGMYFGGYHLEPATADDLKADQLPWNRYVDTGITVNSIYEITKPVVNGVYSIRGPLPPFRAAAEEESAEEDVIPADKEFAEFRQQAMRGVNKVIYHLGKWQLFSGDGDVLCAVNAIVDYCCEVERGEY